MKSGYYLLLQDRIQEENSHSSIMPKWWKSLWHLKIPQKVQVFMWHVVNGALPTKMALAKRRLQMEERCNGCSKAKSLSHALFECGFAKAMWWGIGFWELVKACWMENVSEVVLRVFW